MRYFLALLLFFSNAVFAQEQQAPKTPALEMVQPNTAMEMEELRPEPPTYEGAFMKMILFLILLLFVIFFVIWAVRRLTHARMGLFKDTKHIRIIDRRPLSPKTALYLLEIGDRRVLVAESQLEVKALTSMDTAPAEE